jgi:hypothetical protein
MKLLISNLKKKLRNHEKIFIIVVVIVIVVIRGNMHIFEYKIYSLSKIKKTVF